MDKHVKSIDVPTVSQLERMNAINEFLQERGFGNAWATVCDGRFVVMQEYPEDMPKAEQNRTAWEIGQALAEFAAQQNRSAHPKPTKVTWWKRMRWFCGGHAARR